jgi:3-methyladenine DNA glycosylase AlkD
MPPAYLQSLIRQYEDNRDPVHAARMKKYMKNQFDFYGIGTPARRGMIEEIVRYLWDMKERECQFTVIDLLNRMKKKLGSNDLPLMEYLITTKSWWDTVDGVAGWLVGDIMKRIRTRTCCSDSLKA